MVKHEYKIVLIERKHLREPHNNNNNNFICIAVYTKALYRFTIKKENN